MSLFPKRVKLSRPIPDVIKFSSRPYKMSLSTICYVTRQKQWGFSTGSTRFCANITIIYLN